MIKLNSTEDIDFFIQKNNIAVLYFGNSSCGVCEALLPKFKDLLVKFPNVKSAYVEIEDVKKSMAKYSIFTIPVILLYVEQQEVLREARFISINDIEDKIQRIIKLYEG
ncbi:thioredoxin family protein [Clostridium amazonitimonense]|uniref:thioredoxin family protein n=1 Tax=Clostridium amazonitimonense TaxID=1499689 RepID=UPI00050999C9|nr:thioredoxin family protein [Clostridium amazonitimonense]